MCEESPVLNSKQDLGHPTPIPPSGVSNGVVPSTVLAQDPTLVLNLIYGENRGLAQDPMLYCLCQRSRSCPQMCTLCNERACTAQCVLCTRSRCPVCVPSLYSFEELTGSSFPSRAPVGDLRAADYFAEVSFYEMRVCTECAPAVKLRKMRIHHPLSGMFLPFIKPLPVQPSDLSKDFCLTAPGAQAVTAGTSKVCSCHPPPDSQDRL